MPKNLFPPLIHRPQEADAGCLAACTQMILERMGIQVTQTKLNQLFGLTIGGVPLTRLTRLESTFGVHVMLEHGDEHTIQSFINENAPLLVFVRTNQLSYWTIDTRHTLIVVGYDTEHVWLHDPAFADAPIKVLMDELMLAWLEFDYQYAVLK